MLLKLYICLLTPTPPTEPFCPDNKECRYHVLNPASAYPTPSIELLRLRLTFFGPSCCPAIASLEPLPFLLPSSFRSSLCGPAMLAPFAAGMSPVISDLSSDDSEACSAYSASLRLRLRGAASSSAAEPLSCMPTWAASVAACRSAVDDTACILSRGQREQQADTLTPADSLYLSLCTCTTNKADGAISNCCGSVYSAKFLERAGARSIASSITCMQEAAHSWLPGFRQLLPGPDRHVRLGH